MLIEFFLHLKTHELPVSTREYLDLLAAMQARVASHSIDDFYFLSRALLVKDEANYDRFDRAFGEYFKGVQQIPGMDAEIPEDWLKLLAKKHLSPEEKARLEKLGWDKLMEEFRNLDDTLELGTRNIKVALRRLRQFAREGAADELDLDSTIDATARNAGWLDLMMRPERHNAVKVLLFFDVGGSMEDHVRICEELFSACRAEFKHLEYFYFHNCLYEGVWQDSRRRWHERIPTADVMHKYGPDYRLIFVGDATMSPYEIIQPGGSVEYMNPEPGALWMRRVLATWQSACWLNPEPEQLWNYRQSISLIREIMGERMFPLTLDGLTRAMTHLTKKH